MKFSIIIPVYNVAPYIRISLGSLLAQDYPDWEAICVDDGSSDGSGSVLDQYAKTDLRIKVIHQQNSGVSSARNAALGLANGEYVLFLDADDAYVTNALSCLKAIAEKYGQPDIIAYSANSVDHHVPDYAIAYTDSQCHGYDLNECADLRMVAQKHLCSMIAWNACYRREMIRGVEFLHYPNGEDIIWAAQCLTRSRRFVDLDAPLYRHLDRPGSALQTKSLRHAESAVSVTGELLGLLSVWPKAGQVGAIILKRLLAQHLGYVRAVVMAVPAEQRQEVLKKYVAMLNALCRRQAFVDGLMKVYLYVASCNRFFRFAMLYVPFDCQKKKHAVK